MPRLRVAGLWRHPDFLKLWAGETISAFGSEITNLAIPLAAVLMLQATPVQMGILKTSGVVPALAVGLFAGVWVDRLRRRPVLIWADIGRALLLATIPMGYALGLLRIEHLYAVIFLTGLLSTFFDTAYFSYLPSLVGKEHLVEGNSKLHVTSSAASIAGPALAGSLVQLATAPLVILLDALSFLASAVFLSRIRSPEPYLESPDRSRDVRGELAEGLRVVVGDPLLRAIAGSNATYNLSSNVLFAVYLLYLTRELRLEPSVVGLIFAAIGPGFLLGATLARRITERAGLGPTLVGASLLVGIANLLIPLSGTIPMTVPLLLAAQFLAGIGGMVFSLDQLSLRQAITPDRLLGRMNATMRVISWSAAPVGALLGGGLGQVIGFRPTLFAGAAGTMLSVVWLLSSPIPALRRLPDRGANESHAGDSLAGERKHAALDEDT